MEFTPDTPQTPESPEYPYTFHGSYTRSVDAKGRMHLPFRFRGKNQGLVEEDLDQEWYMISPGAEGEVVLATHEYWMDNFQRARREPPSPQRSQNLRFISSNSYKVVPDSQGRVVIPTKVLTALGIDKKITVIGMGPYMELWPPVDAEDSEPVQEAPTDGFLYGFYR